MTGAERYAGRDGTVPLARLLRLAFDVLIDDLHARLAERGWPGIRPAYGYVLVSAQASPCRVSDVARVLGVTKQAASQVVDAMVAEGYVLRDADPEDARARVVALTERGHGLLAVVEDVYRELEGEWAALIGPEGVARMRTDLLTVVEGRLTPLTGR